MIYSIDTSAILHGWHRAYPPAKFRSLWERLTELIQEKQLVATEEVLVELEKKDDEVYKWAREHNEMFIPIDEEIQNVVQDILKNYRKLLDTRKSRSGADPFVIALARIKNCTVVTNEPKTGNPSRPNIPDVCEPLDIRCIDLLQLIMEQPWLF